MESKDYKRLLLWLLLYLLFIESVMLLLQGNTSHVLTPDAALSSDDPNALTENDETEPEDRVLIQLPRGTVMFDFSENSRIGSYENAVITVFLDADAAEPLISQQAILLSPDGLIPELMLDFESLKYELKPGHHQGIVSLRFPDGKLVEIPVLIAVQNTCGGFMTAAYSKKVNIDPENRSISMKYSHGSDATHDCILQLILDNGKKEYLLAQSGILHPGQSLYKMLLKEDAALELEPGIYHGRLRVNLFNGESQLTNMKSDIQVSITVE